MTTVRIDRLQILADELRKPLSVTFDMRIIAKRNECGTSACALGVAGSIPELKKEGCGLLWDIDHIPMMAVFHYDAKLGWPAAETFFGLSFEQCNKLFLPEENEEGEYDNCTPSEKADQIEALIREVRGE